MRTIGAVSLLVLAGALQAWAAGPVDQNFQAKRVHLDGLVAQVTFDNVPAGAPVHVQANGKPDVPTAAGPLAPGGRSTRTIVIRPGPLAWTSPVI